MQVIDFERDKEQLQAGEKSEKDITYHTLLGLKTDLTGAEYNDESEADDSQSDDTSDKTSGKFRFKYK